ncbi:hypothetical protein BST12_29930, partial [Mycobacterium angelicum]
LYPGATTIALPTYPFQHRSYWLTPAAGVGTFSDPAEGQLWDAVDSDAVDTVAQVLGLQAGAQTDSLPAVVAALRHWRQHLAERARVDQLRYQV